MDFFGILAGLCLLIWLAYRSWSVLLLAPARAGGGEIGRKAEFILQEMGREVNTTGAKANDYEIARRVIELKNELERIKEQIANVE